MQFFWLVIGIVGILGAIVPAAQMGTEIYFDFQLFMLVVGIGIFHMLWHDYSPCLSGDSK